MMKLMDFSKDKLNRSKPFELVYPDGTATGATVYIRSLKSKEALAKIDELEKRNNQVRAQGSKAGIQADIEMCAILIDAIEGFTIKEEDNTLGLEVKGESVTSTRENIRIIAENFPFICRQVVAQAQDDNFFYQSTSSEKEQDPA